jgi:superoxide reductase
MTEQDGIYKCSVCGNVVSTLYAAGPPLVCCGQDMDKLEEKTADEGKEKHVPVVEADGDTVTVKVGSVEHPMEEKHHIALIQLMKGGKIIDEKRLYPGEKPEAKFCCVEAEGVTAREVCNVHGLWKG